ncbi:XRE family transcriptional regulator [Draconibacterium orientale]|uniref:helix-turn-helix domain-containing protein n=1 Tax=Draconibacterium orientale TaxID=1168034 RepID=UPI0029C0900D|nr:XRE family transcriptional regulator [Draconibacterium orientale]
MSISKRLIAARKMAGYSISELARVSNISKQALSLYEKDEMMPSSEYLIRLAHALNVDIDFLYNTENNVSEVKIAGKIHYRKEDQIVEGELEKVKQYTLDRLESYFELEKLSDEKYPFKNPVDKLPIKSKNDAEKAAKQVRKKWKLGDMPLNNILSILESKNIRIVELETSERFNGFAAWVGKIPVIVINTGFGEITRVRFTTLHELGHLILDIDDNFKDEEIERLCDSFASELLLPQELLVIEIGSKRSRISMNELRTIKEKYGISIFAIMYKLFVKGVISSTTFNLWKTQYNEYFENQEDVFGHYKEEESAKRYNQLLIRCLMEGKVSINKAASISGKSAQVLKRMLTFDSNFYTADEISC